MSQFPTSAISDSMEEQRHAFEAATFNAIADGIVAAENGQFLAACKAGFMFTLQVNLQVWAKKTGGKVKAADIQAHILANLVAKGRQIEKRGNAPAGCYGSFSQSLAYVQSLKAGELRSNPIRLIRLGKAVALHLQKNYKASIASIMQQPDMESGIEEYIRFVSEYVANTLDRLERVTTGKAKGDAKGAYKSLKERIAASIERKPLESASEIADAIAYLQELAIEMANAPMADMADAA